MKQQPRQLLSSHIVLLAQPFKDDNRIHQQKLGEKVIKRKCEKNRDEEITHDYSSSREQMQKLPNVLPIGTKSSFRGKRPINISRPPKFDFDVQREKISSYLFDAASRVDDHVSSG